MMKIDMQRTVVVLGMIALVGCHKNTSSVEEPPLVVSVAQLKPCQALDYEEFTGRTGSTSTVEIKARATGYLDKVLFADGDQVQTGQILYEIDSRTYEAEVKANQGAVANYAASLKLAHSNLDRARRLLPKKAISEQEFDTYESQSQQYAAQLLSAQAALERAELNLSFCKVRAPTSGRISRSYVQAGNLVTADQTTLTTIVSMDPIYAYFDVDEQTLLRVQQMIREQVSESGIRSAADWLAQANVDEQTKHKAVSILQSPLVLSKRAELRTLLEPKLATESLREFSEIVDSHPKFKSYRETTVPVELGTRIDRGFPFIGRLDFTDNRLDATTGTLHVRGVFSNPDDVLVPNLSVRIRVPLGEPEPALMVSDAAVLTDLDRKFLFVVNEKNEVEQRPVKLGGLFEGMRIIEGGVQAGEWIAVSNLQRARAGMKVTRKQVPMPLPIVKDQAPVSSLVTSHP